ncbi:EF-hand [Wilcoxina mikolae CBS 423.85]|nr:EF-hand [Wilcoxina mikolae CBS 423.85]
MAAELTQDQKEEISDAFNLFDLNQDRKIDYHELKVAMKALGFDCPKPELLEILRRHGVLATGQPPTAGVSPSNLFITYEAFVDIMSQKIAERDPMEEIGRAFELFAGVGSARQDGREPKIGIEDLRRVAKELGENLEEEELQAMIEEFDIDNDGMINREEFISICKGD